MGDAKTTHRIIDHHISRLQLDLGDNKGLQNAHPLRRLHAQARLNFTHPDRKSLFVHIWQQQPATQSALSQPPATQQVFALLFDIAMVDESTMIITELHKTLENLKPGWVYHSNTAGIHQQY